MLRKLPWVEDVLSVIDISTVEFAADIPTGPLHGNQCLVDPSSRSRKIPFLRLLERHTFSL